MRKEDRPTIAERVGRALARGNLRQRETHCELDVITALGVVGINERLSDAVYRLKYANDAKSYDDALRGVYGLACSLDRRGRWRYHRARLRRMARRILDYWLNDGCHLCTGLGYEVIHGTPHLSDRPCKACHGTRKLAMRWVRKLPPKPEGRRATKAAVLAWREGIRSRTDFASRHRALLVELETIERGMGDKMQARLAA
jgi:hypothetical protein